MKTKNVYRYESNGAGPYTSGCGQKTPEQVKLARHLGLSHMDAEHPGINCDLMRAGLINECESHMVCACPSKRKLQVWFKGFHSRIKKAGYQLKKYTVPREHVYIGDSKRQVTFDPNKALSVEVVE